MKLGLKAHLHYRMVQITDLLLQLEASDTPEQVLVQANILFTETDHFSRTRAEDGIGERIWLRVDGDFICDYNAIIEITRKAHDINHLPAVPPHLLPGEAVRYLMPSRYCPVDEFHNVVASEFGHLNGGARIAAMRDWIARTIQYVPGASSSRTTALDTYVQRQGICRDYAHVMISMARASAIPARFASVYAPGVTPQDFHAVAEVYLDHAWHLVDPTGMASADSIAVIGVGMDAAEVAFMTSFGPAELVYQWVEVDVLPD